MTVQSPRLGAPALEAVSITARFHWPDGWRLHFSYRRSGSALWEEEDYSALDPFELQDVVQAVLELKMGS